ncbi:hypothetical protein BLOT_005424 [Blomia tropicalis]|nr:hypothetical protein BLOT_005424 [Blomia tropicalis]
MSSSSLSTSAVPSTSAHIKSFLHGRAGKAIACTTTTTSNSIVTSTTAIGNESSPIAVFTNSSHTPAIDISETCANGDNANLIQPFSSRVQAQQSLPSTPALVRKVCPVHHSISERANVTSIVTNTNTIRTSTTTITTTTTTTKNVNRIRSKSITHLISSGARSSPIDENNNDDEKNSSSNNNNNNQLRKRLSPLRVEDIRRSFENKSLNHCDRNIETNGVVRSSTHSSYKSKSNTNHNVQRLGPKSVLNNGDSVSII